MYKVFIENKPIIFQFNPQTTNVLNKENVWREINSYLLRDEPELLITLNEELEFEEVFADYKRISAAGGLVEKDNAYLFIKRNGVWDIPKGKLESDELPEEGAIREVEEECGINSPVIVRHLINTFHTYEHKGKHILKKTYWYLMKEGNVPYSLKPQHEEGITEVKFVAKVDLAVIKSNTYMSIIDVLNAL